MARRELAGKTGPLPRGGAGDPGFAAVKVLVSSGGHIQNQAEWESYLADSIPAFPFWVKIDACADECNIEHLRLESEAR